MKYTVTQQKEADVSGVVGLAIKSFEDILKAEKKIGKLEMELDMWIRDLSPEDLKVYVEITNEIQKQFEE